MWFLTKHFSTKHTNPKDWLGMQNKHNISRTQAATAGRHKIQIRHNMIQIQCKDDIITIYNIANTYDVIRYNWIGIAIAIEKYNYKLRVCPTQAFYMQIYRAWFLWLSPLVCGPQQTKGISTPKYNSLWKQKKRIFAEPT